MRKQGSVEPECECYSLLLDCDSLLAPGHKTCQGLLQSTFGTKKQTGISKDMCERRHERGDDLLKK